MVRASGPLLDRAFAVGTVDAALASLGSYAVAGAGRRLVLVAVALPSGTPDAACRSCSARRCSRSCGRPPGSRRARAGRRRPRDRRGRRRCADARRRVRRGAALGRSAGGRRARASGAACPSGCSSLLGTWDALWQPGWSGWIVAVAARRLRARHRRAAWPRSPPPRPEPTGRPRRLWALGPFLALAAMIVANPAFAASQSGASLRTAGIVLVAANFVGAGRAAPARPVDGTVAAWAPPRSSSSVSAVRSGSRTSGRSSRSRCSRCAVGFVLAGGAQRAPAGAARHPADGRRHARRRAAARSRRCWSTCSTTTCRCGVDNAWVLVADRARARPVGRCAAARPLAGSSDRLPRSMASVRLLLLPALVLAAVGLVALRHADRRRARPPTAP